MGAVRTSPLVVRIPILVLLLADNATYGYKSLDTVAEKADLAATDFSQDEDFDEQLLQRPQSVPNLSSPTDYLGGFGQLFGGDIGPKNVKSPRPSDILPMSNSQFRGPAGNPSSTPLTGPGAYPTHGQFLKDFLGTTGGLINGGFDLGGSKKSASREYGSKGLISSKILPELKTRSTEVANRIRELVRRVFSYLMFGTGGYRDVLGAIAGDDEPKGPMGFVVTVVRTLVNIFEATKKKNKSPVQDRN